MSDEERLHILVIDDDPGIRSLLREYLAREGYMASVAEDAVAASRLMESLAFDLLIVDKMMPHKDGADFVAELRARGDATPAIILTAAAGLDSRIEGLESGADDYMAKPFAPKELLLRIRAVLKRAGSPVPRGAIRLGLRIYHRASGVVGNESGSRIFARLTGIERRVFNYFLERRGRDIPRDELASAFAQDSRSIDVLVARIRGKVEENPRFPRVVLTARGVGYRVEA